jgi:hypothetical protein
MMKKKSTPRKETEEFNEVMDEMLTMLEPQVLFSALKQYWGTMDQTILFDRLDKGMEFYANFCDWIVKNKAVNQKTAKKAKEMLDEIKDQRTILHHVSNDTNKE